MLLNNFFDILEESQTGEEGLVTKVKFRKDHPIFKGHFPSNPVVPGVCLIQIIKELVEKNQNKDLRLTRADNVKFLNMVNPEETDTASFELTIKQSENIVVKANLISEGKVFLKFSGTFE